MNFENKPVLVFWETTRACSLACVHCRASAITEPLPGELDREQGFDLIDQVTTFGKPYPTMIFTGGDPLHRKDIFELLQHSKEKGVGFSLSPAVTDGLDREMLSKIKSLGTISISISLDGAYAETHDSIRGISGTFHKTIEVLKQSKEVGLSAQVNTTVMKRNFRELPKIFHLIKGLGVKVWEVFFLVKVGRGNAVEDLTPEENEGVCNFLYDASRSGMVVRSVEAPFIRRVAKQRSEGANHLRTNEIYQSLSQELSALEGMPEGNAISTLRPSGTLDGDGIVFVGYDGSIHPGGLVPVNLGNVKSENLSEIYRNNELLREIRQRKFSGNCGLCDYREICGGSRARAYSYHGDPLASDPACIYS